MVSLWGSKDGAEDHANGDGTTSTDGEDSRQPSRGGDRRRGSDPDERTRLLPPRTDGYLDPDDPAVSISVPAYLQYTDCCLLGLSLQSLECPCPKILLGAVLHHQFLVVGPVASLHLCQPAHDAFPRLRILRLFLHNTHFGEPPHRNFILHDTVQAHGNLDPRGFGLPFG